MVVNISHFFEGLSAFLNIDWKVDATIFLVNILLFVFAKQFVDFIDPDRDNENKVKILRTLNILVLALHGADVLLRAVNYSYQNYFINVGISLMVIYGSLFVYSFLCAVLRRRFGIEKSLDGNVTYLDSYSSRIIDIVLLFFIVLTTIYTLIKIWGADSMLETTGIFGIIFAFLAFTSSIWAPDIISGLIILNTEMLVDGDVVLVDGHPDEYVISKVTLIYVILYDVRNNHRVLIRNNQFIRNKIDNLSRIASTDGIRQAITYKIGYPDIGDSTKEERKKSVTEFKSNVDRMFMSAEENCTENPEITINEGRKFEWAMTNAGDYALEYTLWVYLEKIPNTKITGKIRKHLMGSVYKINEAVYTASIIEGIDLSTPALANISISKDDQLN